MPLDERTVRSNFQRDLVNGAGGALFLAAVYANGAVVIARLGADATTVAVLTAIPFVVNVVMLLLTPFIPRNRPVVLLVVASLLTRLASIPAGWAPTPGVMLAAWAFLALFLSLSSLPALDVVAGMYPPGRRSLLVGRMRTLAIATGLVVGPLAGAALDRWGAGATFTVVAVVSAFCGLFYLGVRAPRTVAPARVSLVGAFALLGEHRQFREFALAWACWGAGVLAPLGVYPVLLVSRFHASYTAIGLLGAITGLASLVTYRWWARQADRRDPRLLAAIGFVIAAAVPAIYGVSPSFAPLGLAAVASGVSVGAMEMGNLQAMLRMAPPGEGVRYTAVFNAITGLRGAIVPIAGSAMVARYGAEPVLLVAAAIGVVSAAYMGASSRTPLPAPGA